MPNFVDKIIQGDALSVLKRLPDQCVDMVITSPPYWGLRDYGVDNQLGLEPTFQEYLEKLCNIFDEVKRVLKKSGTCWVNIGDTYNHSCVINFKKRFNKQPFNKNTSFGRAGQFGYPDKCLTQIPSRFAIEMTNRGWILRNEIIWHKPNCMPCSIKDRFTVDFEKIFFFAKNRKYYFETQYEPVSENYARDKRPHGVLRQRLYKNSKYKKYDYGNDQFKNKIEIKQQTRELKRNKRSVWKIPTKPYPEAHFAVYPEELIATPIKAGCPEFVCKKCGKPRKKIEKYLEKPKSTGTGKERFKEYTAKGMLGGKGGTSHTVPKGTVYQTPTEIIGYTDCGCNAGFEPGIVLDPFMGSGTTAVVARKLGRRYVGIELNSNYIKLANDRLAQQNLF